MSVGVRAERLARLEASETAQLIQIDVDPAEMIGDDSNTIRIVGDTTAVLSALAGGLTAVDADPGFAT